MIKKKFIRSTFIFFVLFFVSMTNTICVYAKDEAMKAKTYSDAEKICSDKKLKSMDQDEYAENCINAGCEFDTSEKICYPIKCQDAAHDAGCNSFTYCDFDKTKTASCVEKERLDCGWYMNCLSTDNNGHNCDTSKCNSYSVIDDINKSYNPSDSNKFCRMLYDSRNVKASKNTATKLLCDKILSYGKSFDYNACIEGDLTLGQIYSMICVDPKKQCDANQYSYYLDVLGEYGGYHCECLYGRDSKGNCKNHGGGGIGKCKSDYDYVENGYNMNCVSDSCVKADCNISANPMNRIDSHFYDPGLTVFDGNTNVRKYDKAYMYTGSCNGKDTDVYCIDPSAAYHDNNADYKCNAALNEDGTTDPGFIKIYQTAIHKNGYQEAMKQKNKPLSMGGDATKRYYAGIHMALRYWTFYSGFGINEDKREHNQNIAKAFSGTSFYIAEEYGFTLENADYKNWTFKTKFQNSWKIAVGKNPSETQGYRDAIEFFKAAAGQEPIWKNPLEFQMVSRTEDKSEATVRLNNIDKLADDSGYIYWNFVKNVSCTDANGQNGNCEIITPLPEYLLNDGSLVNDKGSIEFKVKIFDVSKPFTLSVKYYDRRDAKNIIIATSSSEKGSYQRLLFIASEPRDFIYDKTFGTNSACSISNGKYYHDGKEITRDKFLDSCCGELTNPSLSTKFCQLNKNSNICSGNTVNKDWINNKCLTPCMPTNTTDKCSKTDTVNKDIYISDLTQKEGSMYVEDGSNDKYCYTCAYSGDLTGKKDAFLASGDNPYCAIYCVKDYKFTVPTNLGVNGDLKYGRYLSIGIGATGTQTCFTGEINTRKFKEDYKNAIDAADAAIKEYAKWKNVDVDKLNCTDEKLTCSKDDNWSCDDGGGDYYNCGFDSTNKWCNCMSRSTGNPVLQVKATQTQTGCSKNYTAYHITVNGVNFGSGNQSCDTSNCNTSDGTCDNVKKKVQDTIDEKYQNMINAAKNVNDIIAKYNSCSTFNQNFDFNPKIEFSYEESQYMSLLGDQNYLVGNPQTTDSSTEYYDSIGECSFINKNGKTTDSCVTHNNTRYVLNNETGLYEKKYDQDINCNVYVKTTETKYAALTPVASWCTKIGSGAAVLSGGGNSCGLNYRNIGNVYPLGRNCGKDKNDYRYGLKISNLGNVETVLSTVSGTGINNNLQYACDYHVNNKSCEGCESLYYYRSVSLNDLFTKVKEFHDMSNGDKIITNKVNGQDKKGGNRIIYDYTWSSSKGQDTKKAIEELGEGAYTKDHLQYSYELTPAGMKVIREYNDKVETIEAGGYGDFNLKCNGYNCISDFLNDIENKKYQGVISLKRYTDFTPYNGKPWK